MNGCGEAGGEQVGRQFGVQRQLLSLLARRQLDAVLQRLSDYGSVLSELSRNRQATTIDYHCNAIN